MCEEVEFGPWLGEARLALGAGHVTGHPSMEGTSMAGACALMAIAESLRELVKETKETNKHLGTIAANMPWHV